MTTYVIEKTSCYDELTVADLLPFVDASGRLDVRIEGDAVRRPFAVLNLLRTAGFLQTHSWVEEEGDDAPRALRVTAVLPKADVPDSATRLRAEASLAGARH